MMDLAKRVVEYLGVLSALFTAGWFIIQPHADDYIKGKVTDQIVILQDQLIQLKQKESEAEKSAVRTESDLASIKALQRQTQELLEALLQQMRNR